MDGILSNTFLLAQIFGFCAMCCSVCVWQIKNPRMILLLYVPTSLFWAAQFFLLGSTMAALICLLCVVKDFLLSFIDKKRAPKVITFFLLATWSLGILTLNTAIEVLPLVTLTIFNLALLQPDNRALMARTNIATQILWIAFNITIGAYMGLACSFLLIGSTLIGMARHEKWKIGKCHKSFMPSIFKPLFLTQNWKAYPWLNQSLCPHKF